MKHVERQSDTARVPAETPEAFVVPLEDADATVRVGLELGQAFLRARQQTNGKSPSAFDALQSILLYGDLGTGKTTFTRGFVSAFPGGDEAEVASPSFTLCNSYPTTPPVLHCDLYRSEGALPDEVDEALDAATGLVLVEWAERLPDWILPRERLDICFQSCKTTRLMTLIPHGGAACRVLQELQIVQHLAASRKQQSP